MRDHDGNASSGGSGFAGGVRKPLEEFELCVGIESRSRLIKYL